MDEVLDALRAQQDELTALLAPLPDADWRRPSACPGWAVADVVLHLAQTNELALASVRQELPPVPETPPAGAIDENAAASVGQEQGMPAAELLRRWSDGAAELCAAFAACDPSARLQWVAGTLAARTLATTRLAETWIHTGDVFFAFGMEPPAHDRLWHIARLAHRTLPYAFEREGRALSGPVAFRLTGPSGEAWDFGEDAPSVVRGSAYELCRVAARRVPPSETALVAEGPDAATALEVVRTWA